MESIDALKTHYEGYHQSHTFALTVLESLVELVGIKSVTNSLSEIADADEGKAGFIASTETSRSGHPVSYLFQKSAKLTTAPCGFRNPAN